MLLVLFGIGLGAGLGISAPATAQTKEVKIGLIAPMSGPWARQGELMLKGANLAVDDINKQGGIKSLGGAMVKLLVFDAGDSVEKAKNAAQRMFSITSVRRTNASSSSPSPTRRATIAEAIANSRLNFASSAVFGS